MSSELGKCALCLAEPVELRESHILPRWAYLRLRDRTAKNQEPLFVQNKRAVQRPKQVKEPMLCDDCEHRLKWGDDYAASLAIDRGTLPARALVGREYLVAERRSSERIALRELGAIDRNRSIYFALSVIWRAHVARSVPECCLGPHAETFRRYLLGTAQLPSRTAVHMSLVDSDEPGWHVVANLMWLPQSNPKRTSDAGGSDRFFSHEFALCGLYFAVRTGIGPAAGCCGLTGDPPVVEIVSRHVFLSWLPDEIAETKRVSPRTAGR
jgi:hypothetical protein